MARRTLAAANGDAAAIHGFCFSAPSFFDGFAGIIFSFPPGDC
jgi:hypothetical protein